MGGVEKLIGKLINNALPGRLGMGEKDEKTILVTKESRNEYDIIEEIEISDNLFAIKIRNKNKIENIQSNVIIASQVTALGRIRLWKAMKEVMKAGGRLLYTDTDSIFAEYAESMVGKRIGEMFYDPKKNDTILKKAVFCKPKCYGYELLCGKQVIKIKGIRDTGKGNLKNLMESFESNTMLKFDQTYFSKKNFNISILDIQKEIKLDNYEKRI